MYIIEAKKRDGTVHYYGPFKNMPRAIEYCRSLAEYITREVKPLIGVNNPGEG